MSERIIRVPLEDVLDVDKPFLDQTQQLMRAFRLANVALDATGIRLLPTFKLDKFIPRTEPDHDEK